jgi:hypothetical protein
VGRLPNPEMRAAAENKRRQRRQNDKDAFHGKTSWFV